MLETKMNADELSAFLAQEFPQALEQGFEIDRFTTEGIVLRLECTQRHLRPGNTVSGPTIMWLSDAAFWLALLARVGPEAMSVTTNININFLRKATAGPLFAEARILKLGRRLAAGDVTLTQPEVEGPIAHATLTYSRP